MGCSNSLNGHLSSILFVEVIVSVDLTPTSPSPLPPLPFSPLLFLPPLLSGSSLLFNLYAVVRMWPRYRLSQLHRALPRRSTHPQSLSPSSTSFPPFASLLAATRFLPTQPTNTVFFVGRRTICSRRSIGFQTFTPRFPHHLSSAKSFSTYSESMSVDNKGASKFLLTMSIVILRYLCSAYFFFFFANRYKTTTANRRYATERNTDRRTQ